MKLLLASEQRSCSRVPATGMCTVTAAASRYMVLNLEPDVIPLLESKTRCKVVAAMPTTGRAHTHVVGLLADNGIGRQYIV